jgi:DNA-binding MarR family transcriptional regulator
VPQPLDPDLVDQLRLAVVRLERRLRKIGLTEGVTPSQYSALSLVGRHGPLRLGELARREQISKSTVTRLVAGLERGGLVRRTEDDTDGRSAFVELSAEGRDLLSEMTRGSNDYLRDRLEALDEHDRARLADAIEILARVAARP